MTMSNNSARGIVSDSDLEILIAVLAHLEAIYMVNEDPRDIIDTLLAKLQEGMIRRGLAATGAREDVQAGIRRMNMRLRLALGEDLPPEDRV
jgi:hypothetical protein